MFNGIIFNQGVIKNFEKRPKGINIFVKSDLKLSKKDLMMNRVTNPAITKLMSKNNGILPFR